MTISMSCGDNLCDLLSGFWSLSYFLYETLQLSHFALQSVDARGFLFQLRKTALAAFEGVHPPGQFLDVSDAGGENPVVIDTQKVGDVLAVNKHASRIAFTSAGHKFVVGRNRFDGQVQFSVARDHAHAIADLEAMRFGQRYSQAFFAA